MSLSWTCLPPSGLCGHFSLFHLPGVPSPRPAYHSFYVPSSTGPSSISSECSLNLSYHRTVNYNYLCVYFIASSRIGPLMLSYACLLWYPVSGTKPHGSRNSRRLCFSGKSKEPHEHSKGTPSPREGDRTVVVEILFGLNKTKTFVPLIPN